MHEAERNEKLNSNIYTDQHNNIFKENFNISNVDSDCMSGRGWHLLMTQQNLFWLSHKSVLVHTPTECTWKYLCFEVKAALEEMGIFATVELD